MNVLSLSVQTEPGVGDGSFRIYPVGDIHIDLLKCDRQRLRAYIKLIASDPHAMYVLLGDLVDGTTIGHRFMELQVIRPDVLLNMNEYASALITELSLELEPLKDTPGVILQGNHDIRQGVQYSGFAPEVARRVDAQYGGDECLIRVMANGTNKTRGSTVWVVEAYHGAGGGQQPGAKINRQQRVQSLLTDADVSLSAHTHDSISRVVPTYTVSRKGPVRLMERPRAFIIAPGFVRNRMEGVNDYASRKGLPPNDQGLVYLECINQRTNVDRKIIRHEAPF